MNPQSSPPIYQLTHLHRGAVPCRSAAATHISPSCPDLPSRVFSEVWRCVRSGGRGRRNTWPACKSNGFSGETLGEKGQGVTPLENLMWSRNAYNVLVGVPLTSSRRIMDCSRCLRHQPSEFQVGKSPSFLVSFHGGTPPFGRAPSKF